MRTAALLLLVLSYFVHHDADADSITLTHYIDALREQGIDILYSDNLVKPSMRIDAQDGTPSLAGLSKHLETIGLELTQGPERKLLVTRRNGAALLTLTGVVSSANGDRVSNALVEISNGRTTRTDRLGRFTLQSSADNALALRVSSPTYQTYEATLTARQGNARQAISIVLQPMIATLDTIIVSASHHELAVTDGSHPTSIDREQLQSLPLLGGEPLRALSHLPATTSAGIESRSHVRGGEQTEVLMMVDGLRLYEPYHLRDFYSPASVLNGAAIDSITFYSGGFPAQYGDRMSAVIDIDLREPQAPRQTEIDISTLNTSVQHMGYTNNVDWLISVRRSNLDLVLEQFERDFGTPRFGELLAHARWHVRPNASLSANMLVSQDKARLDSTLGETAEADYDNRYFWLRWQQQLSDTTAIDSVLSLTRIDSARSGNQMRPGVVEASLNDRRSLDIYGMTQRLRWHPSDSWQAYAGIDYKFIRADYNYQSSGEIDPPFSLIAGTETLQARTILRDVDGGQYGAYLGLRWQSARWAIDAGGRWDQQAYTTAVNDEQFSPRISLSYSRSDRTQWRWSWGRYHQAEEPNELQIDAGLNEFALAQRSEHTIASVDHRVSRTLQLRAEAYIKTSDNLRPRFENLFDPLVLLPELQFDRVRIDARSARHRGVELLIKHQTERAPFSWWLSYAWAQSTDRTPMGNVPRSWDQTHALQGGLHWQSSTWQLTLLGTVRSGWPKTALSLQQDTLTNSLSLQPARRNGDRFATFRSLDLRVSRDFRIGYGTLTGYLDVQNLLNQRNACCVEYDLTATPDGQTVLSADQDNWLPIVPTLGVNWRF